ncbi:hypothetical protein [Candidatus Nitrosacidococcus sp. I8]|uniref:hypothetical protein n=1 Tax=Candidatus Nitrosacidococcus sp. I8 TaxID=2942908 RepID=UPI002226A9F4|nr:hypothetical protein [Candidatus Nitrosacidococcus sp. I8]CAH9017877.1 hypothetical protein NURINAE_00603 [Candidatus Nitrosacidococcus sp. I8]
MRSSKISVALVLSTMLASAHAISPPLVQNGDIFDTVKISSIPVNGSMQLDSKSSNDGSPSVLESATVTLFGTGLFGLAFFMRRRTIDLS